MSQKYELTGEQLEPEISAFAQQTFIEMSHFL